MDRRLLAIAVLALTATVAACDPRISPASPTTASGAPASTAASASESLLPIPSFGAEFHGAPDLEARLPSELDGQPLVVVSLRGDTFFENTVPELERFRAVVEAVGGEGDDVSIAIANAAVGASPFNLAALRVEGAEAEPLAAAFQRAALEAQAGGTAGHANLGGKEIVKVAAPGNLAGNSYFYASGDTVFVVQAPDDGLAARLLETLP